MNVHDEPCVHVRVVLRPSTYKAYAARAAELHVEVGDLLSHAADVSVKRPKREMRKWVRLTVEQRAEVHELRADGWSVTSIAEAFHVSGQTVRNILREVP